MGENELVGQSAAMRDVRRLIDIVAPSKTTILIQGATGTGKELVARSIHKCSSRKGEMISINCSAICSKLDCEGSINSGCKAVPLSLNLTKSFVSTVLATTLIDVILACFFGDQFVKNGLFARAGAQDAP